MYAKRIFLIVLVVLMCKTIYSSSSFQLVGKVPTPDSILSDPTKYIPCDVGAKTRYSTCTDAFWFHHDYLAVANFCGEHIMVYYFDETNKEFTLIQQIKNEDGAQFRYPEGLAVSPDGTLLAVVNNGAESYISLYLIDAQTHVIDPVPFFRITGKGFIHNARFSPDGAYLVYVSFDEKESICVYRIEGNS